MRALLAIGAALSALLLAAVPMHRSSSRTGLERGGTVSGNLDIQGDAGVAGALLVGTLTVQGSTVLGVLSTGDLVILGFTQGQDAGFNRVHGEEFISHAQSGADGFSATNSGVHWQIGPGANESFFGTGGAGPRTTGSLTAGGEITSGADGYRTTTANTWKGNGYALDGGTAFQWLAGSMDFDAGTHTVWAVNDGGMFPIARMMADGYIASRVPETLLSLYTNAVNNATTYGGLCITRPFTVTQHSIYVSNTAGAGTNNVIRVSDGTNNCDTTWSCASDLNTTGAKIKSPTGDCAFAAGACLTVSETTAGCAPDPTLKSITIRGWNQ